MYTIQICKRNESHWWRLVAANGRILAQSECYCSASAAKRAALKVLTDLSENRVFVGIKEEAAE